jgi:hypothetical protein
VLARIALLLAVSLATACEARLSLGVGCSRSADCASPLVCRFERCRTECDTERDCPLGASCIRDGSGGVCRLPTESACSSDGDCPGALVCASGVCRNHCRDGTDCSAGASCVADPLAGTVCIEPENGRDAGVTLDVASPTDARTTFVVPITSDEDDGFIEPGTGVQPMGDGFTIWAGAQTQGPDRVYLRFELPVAIPAGATVVAAHLEVWGTAYYDSSGTTCLPSYRLGIVADDVADAAVVTAEGAYPDGPTGPAATAASVAWPFVGAWVVDGVNTSPSIAPILQELVDDHGGLAAGTHVQFWSWALDFVAECAVGIEDHSSIASHHAELHVTVLP